MNIDKVKLISFIQKKNVPLFKQELNTNDSISYNSNNVIKNGYLGAWNKLILGSIAKMNPILINHPRFASIILKAGEKVIRKHDKFFEINI